MKNITKMIDLGNKNWNKVFQYPPTKLVEKLNLNSLQGDILKCITYIQNEKFENKIQNLNYLNLALCNCEIASKKYNNNKGFRIERHCVSLMNLISVYVKSNNMLNECTHIIFNLVQSDYDRTKKLILELIDIYKKNILII